MLFPSMPHESVGSRTAIPNMYIRTCVNIRRCIVVLLSLLAPLFSVLGQVRQQPDTQHTISMSGTPIDIEWSNDRKRILILVRPSNVNHDSYNQLYVVDVQSGETRRVDALQINRILATRGRLGTFVGRDKEMYRLNDTSGILIERMLTRFEGSSGGGDGNTHPTQDIPTLFQMHNNRFLCQSDYIVRSIWTGRQFDTYQERVLRLVNVTNGLVTDSIVVPGWSSQTFVRDAELSRSGNTTLITNKTIRLNASQFSYTLGLLTASNEGKLTFATYAYDSHRPFFWFDDIDSVVLGTRIVSRPWVRKATEIRDHAAQTRPIILPSYRHRLDQAASPEGTRLAVMPLLSDSVFVWFQSPHPAHTYTLSPEDDKLAVISRSSTKDSVWTLSTFSLEFDYASMQRPLSLRPLYSSDTAFVGDSVHVRDHSDYGTHILRNAERRWFPDSVRQHVESGDILRAAGIKHITTTYSFVDTTIIHRQQLVGRFWDGSRYSHRTTYQRNLAAFTGFYFLFDTSALSLTVNNHGREQIRYFLHQNTDSVSVSRISRLDPLFVNSTNDFSVKVSDKYPYICLTIARNGATVAEHCGYELRLEHCPPVNRQNVEHSRILVQTKYSPDRILASWHSFNRCDGSNSNDPKDGEETILGRANAWVYYIDSEIRGEGIQRVINAPDSLIMDATIHPQGDLILLTSSFIQRYDPIRDTILWKTNAPRLFSGLAYGNKHILTHSYVIDWATGRILKINEFGRTAAVTQSPKHGIAVVITQESDSNVVLYDVDERKLVRRIATYRGNADLVSVSRDGDAYAVLDSNGMLSVFDLDIKDLVTSMDEGDTDVHVPALRVKPNPATFDVTITIDSGEPTMVDIMSSEGRLVTTFPVTGSTTLPIDSLPVGYYRVVARMRNGLQSVPLVIVR